MKHITRLIGFGYLAIVLLAAVASAAVGPIGYAPIPITIGPEPEPIVVTIWYDTEKRAWLEEAVKRFEATNPRQGRRPISIVLRGVGSREIAERVATRNWGSSGQPTAVSPSSSIWVELLRSEWAARGNPGSISEDSGTPLALTPLVLVSWEERAQFLWPTEQADLWNNLHDALADDRGWPEVVRRAGFAESSPEYERARSWGTVKLGHTSPLTSNGGTQLLLLLAYAFYGKTSGLTAAEVQQPAFTTWLQEIERAVPKFGASSSAFMEELVRFGPSQYDVVATYENQAIENIEAAKRWGTLRVYYPPATSFSDHPYVVLDAPWTTAEQRAAAGQFRDFLRSRPIQELALQYGFRPADPAVPILTADPANPFNRYQQNGVRTDVAGQVASPSGDVLNALLAMWQQQINR